MENIFTSKSAIEFYENEQLEEWIHKFLCDEGNNEGLSHGLRIEKRYFMKPVKLPLDIVNRCCGPEENNKYKVDADGFEKRVTNIKNRFNSDWDMPPFLVNYDKGRFELNDGNHRHEALKRNGISEHYMIVWITSEADFKDYQKKYWEYYSEK